MLSCPLRDSFDRERFEYEQEYDRLFTGLGFAKEDKKKPISRFSGGEQTKIALIRLLLENRISCCWMSPPTIWIWRPVSGWKVIWGSIKRRL